MGSPWDNREMFEWYLYDYLMKNGRGEIAEIFRREANLPFDPMSPPAIDVPYGFLHEWWLIFHDVLKAWQHKNSDNNGGCSHTVKEMVNGNPQGNTSRSREQEMNEEMIRELTDSSDFELTTGDNLMPLESEQTSQGLISQTQKTSLTVSKLHHQSVLVDVIAEGVGSLNCETLKGKKVEPNESERKNRTSAGSEYRSMPVAVDCPSQTSSPACKSFDDTVKFSHSHDSGNKDDRKTSLEQFTNKSCNF